MRYIAKSGTKKLKEEFCFKKLDPPGIKGRLYLYCLISINSLSSRKRGEGVQRWFKLERKRRKTRVGSCTKENSLSGVGIVKGADHSPVW
jgi:hypothetical protein